MFYPLLLWTCALVSNAEVGQMKEACRVSAAVDHSPASFSLLSAMSFSFSFGFK